ncbi:MAG: c-type cytochrome [Pseudomonadota bacterium]
MNQHDDSSFFRTFALVLGALVIFTIFIAVVANIYSPASDRATDPLVQQEMQRQISPVGQSRVAQAAAEQSAQVQAGVTTTEAAVETQTDTTEAEATEEAEQDVAEPVEETAEEADAADTTEADQTEASDTVAMADTGAEIPLRVRAVVATNCAGCHRDGLLGAQRSDDAQAWQALQDKGLDTLTASVINGKGVMLPRAETSLTDEEISQAISYMIAQATGSDAAPAGDSTEPMQDADASEETATEEMATEDSAEEETAAAQTTEAATSDTATAEAETQTAEAAVVAVADIPANVKSVADTLCASCHISGVANAPKLGDKAAWDERLAMGMDKLLASAIAGKGAMPARGGSTLSDAELRLAIEYMASQ